MKKLLVFTVYLAIIFQLFPSCSAQAKEADTSFFWEVSSGKKTLYLLGTIHVGSEDMYPLKKNVMNAFGKADTLVLELSPAEMQQLPLVMAKYPEKIYMPAGISGFEGLDTTQITLLDSLLGGSKVREQFTTLQPWLTATQLALQVYIMQGYNPSLGVDQWLTSQAQESNKPIIGLETAEFQVDLLSSATLDLQKKMLKDMLADWSRQEDTAKKMMTMYKANDDKAMQQLLEEESDRMSADEVAWQTKIIEGRNVSLTASIQDLLNKDGKKYFVAVGSAHLTGPEGIPALLKAAGFKVKRL